MNKRTRSTVYRDYASRLWIVQWYDIATLRIVLQASCDTWDDALEYLI